MNTLRDPNPSFESYRLERIWLSVGAAAITASLIALAVGDVKLGIGLGTGGAVVGELGILGLSRNTPIAGAESPPPADSENMPY